MADLGHSLWGRDNADKMQEVYQMEEGTPWSENATQALIESLVFAQSKTIRTSTMILASFNILAAFLTASSILYDCYCASKRSNGGRAKKFCVSSIHPAETFPLVLAMGIVIQGAIFSGAQATGLSSLFTDGCAAISMFMFPAIFLVPYIQIVFGVECAIRSLRKGGFPARGKYNVSICLAVVVLMLIATAIPVYVRPERDFCFASLAWFVTRFGKLAFGLLLTLICIAIKCAITIFYRLTTLTAIDHRQRIAASRMVYYLVLAVVSMVLVVPWFILLAMGKPTLVTSMMATVVLNLHGLLGGFLQMFLRSNTATTSFRPKGTPGWSRERHEIRFWGPNELGFDEHMLQPVSGPRSPASISSRASLIETEKVRAASIDSVRSPDTIDATKETIKTAGASNLQPVQTVASIEINASCPRKKPSLYGHRRKQSSYSIFPPESIVMSPTEKQKQTLSTKTWKIPESRFKDALPGLFSFSSNQQSVDEYIHNPTDLLAPPPALFASNPSRHRRDSSIQTSVTVEIGLRLSHAPTELQSPSPPRSRRASPLLRLQTNLFPRLSRSAAVPSPLRPSAVGSPLAADVRAARMKTLPPIPRGSTVSRSSAAPEEMTKLSPTTYSPQGVKQAIGSPPLRPAAPSPLWPQRKTETSRGSKSSWI